MHGHFYYLLIAASFANNLANRSAFNLAVDLSGIDGSSSITTDRIIDDATGGYVIDDATGNRIING